MSATRGYTVFVQPFDHNFTWLTRLLEWADPWKIRKYQPKTAAVEVPVVSWIENHGMSSLINNIEQHLCQTLVFAPHLHIRLPIESRRGKHITSTNSILPYMERLCTDLRNYYIRPFVKKIPRKRQVSTLYCGHLPALQDCETIVVLYNLAPPLAF